jgi:hypothetical protein
VAAINRAVRKLLSAITTGSALFMLMTGLAWVLASDSLPGG